jgi:hypothetical protein
MRGAISLISELLCLIVMLIAMRILHIFVGCLLPSPAAECRRTLRWSVGARAASSHTISDSRSNGTCCCSSQHLSTGIITLNRFSMVGVRLDDGRTPRCEGGGARTTAARRRTRLIEEAHTELEFDMCFLHSLEGQWCRNINMSTHMSNTAAIRCLASVIASRLELLHASAARSLAVDRIISPSLRSCTHASLALLQQCSTCKQIDARVRAKLVSRALIADACECAVRRRRSESKR